MSLITMTKSRDGIDRFTVRVLQRCQPNDLIMAAADLVASRHYKGRGEIDALAAEIGARAVVNHLRLKLALDGSGWEANGEEDIAEQCRKAVEPRVRELFPEAFPTTPKRKRG